MTAIYKQSLNKNSFEVKKRLRFSMFEQRKDLTLDLIELKMQEEWLLLENYKKHCEV